MKLASFAALVSILLSACGDHVPNPSPACEVDCDSGTAPDNRASLWLEVHNAADAERTCSLSIAYSTPDGIIGEVLEAGVSLGANAIAYEDVMLMDAGTQFTMRSGCVDPKDDSKQAAGEYTYILNQSETCRATYSEDGGVPSMRFICWYGRL